MRSETIESVVRCSGAVGVIEDKLAEFNRLSNGVIVGYLDTKSKDKKFVIKIEFKEDVKYDMHSSAEVTRRSSSSWG